MKMIKKLIQKHRSFIAYGIFGVLTTVINIAVYNWSYFVSGKSNNFSNILAWICAVVFAYLTNKIWVFGSKSWKWSILCKEVISFAGCRLSTGALDFAIMFVSVDIMKMNAMLMKIGSNILVIILNYVFSKLIIFKNK